jgi:hypothetical protein
MEMDEETLRKTAYRIWEERGRPDGQDFEHWLQARNEYGDNDNDGLPGSISSSVTPPGVGESLDNLSTDTSSSAENPANTGARKKGKSAT